MDLHVISPLKRWTLPIAWIEINTPVGNFVIEEAHAPMIVTLSSNSTVLFCLTSGKQDSMNVLNGLVHITRESVTLLLSDV